MTESRVAIETLAWLSEYAFEGDSDESLMANLHDMREGDWTALPPGAERTIADVLEHVGWAKWMYEDYAFGPGTMRGDERRLSRPTARRHVRMANCLSGCAKVRGAGSRPSAHFPTTLNSTTCVSPAGATTSGPATSSAS